MYALYCRYSIVHREISSIWSRFVFVSKHVGVDWTVHTLYAKDNEAIQSRCLSWETMTEQLIPFTFSRLNLWSRLLTPSKLSHKCFQPCCSQLQNWHRATVTLQQIILHSLMGFAKSNYQYALRPIEDVLLCYWSALLLSVHSFTCSPSLSYHALFDMHSEAACILKVCPSNTYTQVLV